MLTQFSPDYYILFSMNQRPELFSNFGWPGDRFTKVIVNRKSKITLKISLRARIRAFH
jgi:hypothetical protein